MRRPTFPRHVVVVLLILIALLAANCSASPTATSPDGERTSTIATDRIVVNTSSGELFLVDPDGSNRVDLAGSAASLDAPGLAPVWSPDGQRIAWSEPATSAASRGAIVSTDVDGSNLRRAGTLFSGYFGYWDPTSVTLGFLGNAPPGTGLVLDDGSGTELDQVVDSDTFYYFSWSPDGTRWVVHSGSGLHFANPTGERSDIDLADIFFRAPVWTPDGFVIVAISNEGRNVVIKLDPDTLEFEELLEVGSVTNFVLDPTGRRLMIETVDAPTTGTDFGDNIMPISHRTSRAGGQPTGNGAQVLVYDMMSGSVAPVYDGRIGAAWWSPDGQRLALLVVEEAANPQFAQWLVWRPQGSFRTERFVPTRAFATSYAPFYDQFAQSVTPWSPDSSRFVYTGTDVEGTTGVFVQPANAETSPEWISEGAIAFWSPT